MTAIDGVLSAFLDDVTLSGTAIVPPKSWLNPIQPVNVRSGFGFRLGGDPAVNQQKLEYNPVSGLAISGSIALGNPPPASASSGSGIFMDETGIYGLNSNVVESKIDVTTGKIVAAAGALILGANGIVINPGITAFRFSFMGDITETGAIYAGQGPTDYFDIYGAQHSGSPYPKHLGLNKDDVQLSVTDPSGNLIFTFTSAGINIGKTTRPTSVIEVLVLPPIYADNDSAVAGGLETGAFYRLGGDPDILCIVH